MKQYCKTCGHLCHCIGQGYFVSEPFCSSCSCNQCKCKEEVLILNKPVKPKKFEMYTICVLIVIILGISLLGCSKETYHNKMDSIAEALSKIKK